MGYSRAVRVGPFVFVAGTTATGTDGTLVGGDAHAQTAQVLANIEAALRAAGASLGDVVRTRVFVTDIAAHGQTVGRVHGKIFGAIRPACTMVEVRRLMLPEMLVEIEADAVVIGEEG